MTILTNAQADNVASAGFPQLVFALEDGAQFCLSTRDVLELSALQDMVKVPNTPAHVRGMMKLRGETIPAIDLRRLLGMKAREDEIREFRDIMDQRERDHREWLRVLEETTRERRQFTLGIDPTKCKFGKWYYEYLPRTRDHHFAALLRRFEEPHNHIHSIARKVEALLLKGDDAGAMALIEDTRNTTLQEMVRLFTRVKDYYLESAREVAIVCRTEGGKLALVADDIRSIEKADEASTTPLDTSMGIGTAAGMISGFRRLGNGREVTIELALERLR